MMSTRSEHLASNFIGIVIITYGVMGPYVWPSYQVFAELIIHDSWLPRLLSIFVGTAKDDYNQYNLRIYLVYYPSYVCLHLWLIATVFRHSMKPRRIGLLVILIGLPMLACFILIFLKLNWNLLYVASMDVFRKFVCMPFILFVVEGSRLLDLQIDQLIGEKKVINSK